MLKQMNNKTAGVLIAGFFTILIAYSIRYGYGMLLPEMLTDLEISKTQAGLIYSAYFIAYTVFSPLLGLLSDRTNPRSLLSFFTALLGAGAFLMAFADNLWWAVLFFGLAGLGHSACWSPVVALVQRWVPDARRGSTLGFVTMGSGIGIAAWGFLLPLIVADYGWKTGWRCLGLIGVAVAILNWILVRNPADGGVAQSPGRDPGSADVPARIPYDKLMWDRRLWRIGLSYLLVGFTVMVPYTFLSVYATEGLNLPFAVATRLIAVMAISGMAGKLVLGFGSDALGRIPMMMLCNLLMGLGCLGWACLAATAWLFMCAAFFGLGFGAVWPLYAAAAPDFFNKQDTGSVVGLWTVFLGVGSVLSPVLGGWSIDRSGNYLWAFGMGAVASALAIGFLGPFFKWHVRRKT